jgi:type IV pilus assembly protein PilA
LIELLSVIAIVGILAALAIPQFAEYKIRSYNSRSQSDLRNAIIGQEVYFVDNEQYTDCSNSGCVGLLHGLALSDGISIDVNAQIGNQEFSIESCHIKGNRDYSWKTSGSESNVMLHLDNSGTCAPTAPTIS